MNITTCGQGSHEHGTRVCKELRMRGLPALDLGCGTASHTRKFSNCVFMDIDQTPHTPSGMIVWDIRDVLNSPVKGQRFGTVYLLDVIEHITKEEGRRLISDLQTMAERIVLFTPLGDLWISDDPSPHAHKSGWTPEDLPGWNTWTWPEFHRFADGGVHGAFWAWWSKGVNPTPASVEEMTR